MGDKTGISWTDATWNPVRGCSRVSEGCRNCYAERVAARFSGPGQPYHGFAQVVAPRDLLDRTGGRRNGWTRKVAVVPEHLADPIRWRRPRRIFVNSMSDLFHEGLTNEQIAAVFGVMAAAPRHTFQILTKRAQRMREWFAWIEERIEAEAMDHSGADCGVSIHDARDEERSALLVDCAAEELGEGSEEKRASWYDKLTDDHRDSWARTGDDGGTVWNMPWPLPNVWLGVSVENQEAADERIPELLQTPAGIRFISCEPLLGHLAIAPWMRKNSQAPDVWKPPLDWVIAGCESGPGARPCGVEWLRSLRDQCAAAGVPFFLKQASQPGSEAVGGPLITPGPGSKRKAGGVIELPYLDGVQHVAWPEAV